MAGTSDSNEAEKTSIAAKDRAILVQPSANILCVLHTGGACNGPVLAGKELELYVESDVETYYAVGLHTQAIMYEWVELGAILSKTI